MSYLVSLIRRHPLISFFVLAYALSWWPIAFYAAGLSPSPIISFGPFLAALVVLAATQGKTGVVGLLRRIVRWRCGAQRPSARRQGFLLGRGARWLDGPLLDFCPPAPHSRHRWLLGGAGLERLRPAASANRSLGALCQPDPGGGVGLLAPATLYNRTGPVV